MVARSVVASGPVAALPLRIFRWSLLGAMCLILFGGFKRQSMKARGRRNLVEL
jgi:hypothetical protein